jgi:adrenodoxin-NADP+ reductase
MQDAYTVADQMLADHLTPQSEAVTETPLSYQPTVGAPKSIEEGLKNGEVVDLERWGRIDAAERDRGKQLGKEREKYVRVLDMLNV